jgi:anti-anti-sigma factor
MKASSDVVVDLGELSFADSSLMLDLAMLSRRVRRTGLRVRLVRPQPHIRRLIEIVGLHRLPGIVLDEPAMA